jgi:hypothetical protein
MTGFEIIDMEKQSILWYIYSVQDKLFAVPWR